jgi:two-component system, NtrC family, nitrogen regulation response regulator NtrX
LASTFRNRSLISFSDKTSRFSFLEDGEKSLSKEIFIIDDEKEICRSLKGLLKDEGYQVDFALTPEKALEHIQEKTPDLILLDVWFGKCSWDGVYLLDQLKQLYPMLPVIMISGHGNFELAVQAIKKGAYDFIEKPFELDRLLLSIQRALEASYLRIENAAYRTYALSERAPWPLPIDSSLRRCAQSESRILFTGEPGTGKKSLAEEAHRLSSRKQSAFLVLNSHEINLWPEKNLWGLENEGRIEMMGVLEHVQGGTVVLTNIQSLKKSLQIHFSRLFESQSLLRLGGQKPIPLNVRFLLTSQTNSQELKNVLYKEFFDRITVSVFDVPSLNQKPQNIRIWSQFLLRMLSFELGSIDQKLSEEAIKILQKHSWPGNIRELKHVLAGIVMKHSESVILKNHLPPEISGVFSHLSREDLFSLPLNKARMLFEYEYLSAQLASVNGNVSHAAQIIGMERSALHRKIKSLKIKTEHQASSS